MTDLIGKTAKILVANEPYYAKDELCTIVDMESIIGERSDQYGYWAVFDCSRSRSSSVSKYCASDPLCIGYEGEHFQVVTRAWLEGGLRYDFHGINGAALHRPRLCTFTKNSEILSTREMDALGRLMAAAPEMYMAIKLATVSCGFKRLNPVAQRKLLEALQLAEKGMQ